MKLCFVAITTFFLLLLCSFSSDAQDRIVVLKITGPINPVVAEFISTEIESANREEDSLVILAMDTPGGLDTSMRIIIKSIQRSLVPVASFVSPAGSRAASAGTFILIASHFAAMAPGTNIGAAHPVNMMGGSGDGKKSPMEEKILNDAAAYIRSLAEMRGRNAHWAEMAVRQSVAISAEEAKRLAVIDFVANDLDALILALHDQKTKIGDQAIKLKVKDSTVDHREMSRRQRILDIISNPNVTYVLMMMGIVGLYFELSNPGLILPGALGGISLILALYSMQTLPVNYAGLLLISLGIILFIVELSVISYGLLSLGGAVCLFLGSVMLIDSDDPAMQISRVVLYPTLGLSILFSGGIIYLGLKSRDTKSMMGIEAMIGQKAQVKQALNPQGRVLLHGETWNACCNRYAEVGETVVIEAVDGLKVMVKKHKEEE